MYFNHLHHEEEIKGLRDRLLFLAGDNPSLQVDIEAAYDRRIYRLKNPRKPRKNPDKSKKRTIFSDRERIQAMIAYSRETERIPLQTIYTFLWKNGRGNMGLLERNRLKYWIYKYKIDVEKYLNLYKLQEQEDD